MSATVSVSVADDVAGVLIGAPGRGSGGVSSIRRGYQGREAGKGLGGVLHRGLPACHKCQLLAELFRDHCTGGEVWRWPGFYHPCESALTTIPGPDCACPVESGPLACMPVAARVRRSGVLPYRRRSGRRRLVSSAPSVEVPRAPWIAGRRLRRCRLDFRATLRWSERNGEPAAAARHRVDAPLAAWAAYRGGDV
jgi:hypothetical protein